MGGSETLEVNVARHPKWEEFAVWLETPPNRRGPVTSEAKWGEKHGVASRTLRRWKQDPEFDQVRRAVRVDAEPDGVPTVVDSEGMSDESSYLLVKSKLIEGAASGNPKYMDLYFKTYGKPFVEEEAAARSADLASFEFEGLVLDALDTLGREAVVAGLSKRGWSVVPPEEVNDGEA